MNGDNIKKNESRAWIVYILIFLFPFEIYRVHLSIGIRLTPFHAFAIIAFFFVLILNLSGKISIRKSVISSLLLLYIFSGFLSLLAVENLFPAVRGLCTHFILFSTFVCVISLINHKKELENALTACIVIGMIVSAVALTQFFGFVLFGKMFFVPFIDYSHLDYWELIHKGGFGFMGGLMRPSAFFASKTRMGSYLLIPFGISLCRLFYTHKHKVVYSVTTFILFLSIIISVARNAWISLIVFFGALIFFNKLDKYLENGVRIFLFFITILMLVVLYAHNQFSDVLFLERLNPFNYQMTGEDQSIFISHLKAAVNGNIETLWLGKGIQNFDDWAYYNGYVKEWGSHSNFIIFLGETGVLGLLSQLLIVFFVLKIGLRDYIFMKHTGENKAAMLSLFMVSIYCGLVVSGIIRTFYYAESTFILVAILMRHVAINKKEFHQVHHSSF